MNQKGLSVEVDDEVVGQIPEGQDMVMCCRKAYELRLGDAVDPAGGDDPAMAQPVVSRGAAQLLPVYNFSAPD